MPAGSVSEVAEPHSSSPLGFPSLDQPKVRLVADSLPTGASMADTGVDCARCGGRGGIYIPTLLRELSCPECG
jgi:DNA-directed RNA polymerase subunit RPC12/RpoP